MHIRHVRLFFFSGSELYFYPPPFFFYCFSVGLKSHTIFFPAWLLLFYIFFAVLLSLLSLGLAWQEFGIVWTKVSLLHLSLYLFIYFLMNSIYCYLCMHVDITQFCKAFVVNHTDLVWLDLWYYSLDMICYCVCQ